jgi:hypothetical protein
VVIDLLVEAWYLGAVFLVLCASVIEAVEWCFSLKVITLILCMFSRMFSNVEK